MLNINIICVGKLKEKYLKDALNEYIKRLSRYCKLTITELPDEKIPDKLNPNLEIDIKTKESHNIINHIKKDSYIIALDLTGKQITSEEFSKKIENISMENSNITFIIGGSLGLTTELLRFKKVRLIIDKFYFMLYSLIIFSDNL